MHSENILSPNFFLLYDNPTRNHIYIFLNINSVFKLKCARKNIYLNCLCDFKTKKLFYYHKKKNPFFISSCFVIIQSTYNEFCAKMSSKCSFSVCSFVFFGITNSLYSNINNKILSTFHCNKKKLYCTCRNAC